MPPKDLKDLQEGRRGRAYPSPSILRPVIAPGSTSRSTLQSNGIQGIRLEAQGPIAAQAAWSAGAPAVSGGLILSHTALVRLNWDCPRIAGAPTGGMMRVWQERSRHDGSIRGMREFGGLTPMGSDRGRLLHLLRTPPLYVLLIDTHRAGRCGFCSSDAGRVPPRQGTSAAVPAG